VEQKLKSLPRFGPFLLQNFAEYFFLSRQEGLTIASFFCLLLFEGAFITFQR
jgi:hypothetical protein